MVTAASATAAVEMALGEHADAAGAVGQGLGDAPDLGVEVGDLVLERGHPRRGVEPRLTGQLAVNPGALFLFLGRGEGGVGRPEGGVLDVAAGSPDVGVARAFSSLRGRVQRLRREAPPGARLVVLVLAVVGLALGRPQLEAGVGQSLLVGSQLVLERVAGVVVQLVTGLARDRIPEGSVGGWRVGPPALLLLLGRAAAEGLLELRQPRRGVADECCEVVALPGRSRDGGVGVGHGGVGVLAGLHEAVDDAVVAAPGLLGRVGVPDGGVTRRLGLPEIGFGPGLGGAGGVEGELRLAEVVLRLCDVGLELRAGRNLVVVAVPGCGLGKRHGSSVVDGVRVNRTLGPRREPTVKRPRPTLRPPV